MIFTCFTGSHVFQMGIYMFHVILWDFHLWSHLFHMGIYMGFTRECFQKFTFHMWSTYFTHAFNMFSQVQNTCTRCEHVHMWNSCGFSVRLSDFPFLLLKLKMLLMDRFNNTYTLGRVYTAGALMSNSCLLIISSLHLLLKVTHIQYLHLHYRLAETTQERRTHSEKHRSKRK